MSLRSTYLLIDNIDHIHSSNESTLSLISFFVYNYLINPIVFTKSNRVSLIRHPQSTLEVQHKPLDWYQITNFLSALENTSISTSKDLTASILDILQTIVFNNLKSKSKSTTDVIIISPLNINYDWNSTGDKIKYIIQSNDKINLIFIDSFLQSQSSNHDENINYINNTILNSNINNEQNFMYSLSDAISALTKSSLFTPKFKKPVEIYSYKLQILGLSDLELNISAYPFVKKNSMSDYISTTKIDSQTHSKIKDKYIYYYENKNTNNSRSFESDDINEIKNPEFIIEGYKFGTSNFLITDLSPKILNLNSIKSMVITAFVPKHTIPPWYLKQDSLIILPSSKNVKQKSETIDKDMAIYSELWYSMVRLNVVAMVRYVKKNGMDIKYGLLYPQGFIDEQAEYSGIIDFGCFIFVETVFKDDEKLVNLPNLLKMEISDEKIQTEMDNLVDSFCLDHDDNDDDDDDIDNKIEACAISMNNIPANDIFYGLREEILTASGLSPNQAPGKHLLSNTITSKINKYNSPLMSIDRLIYLTSYFIIQQHLQENPTDNNHQNFSLYELYEKYGIPLDIIEKWLDNAKEDRLFRPQFLVKEDV